MKTLILATVVVLTACAAPQTGPPLAGSSHAAALAAQKSNPCDYPALFDCSSGRAIGVGDNNAATSAKNQADLLYCNMQAQIASSNVRGFLYPAAVYGQIQNTCLQMKAAERAASN